MKLLEIVREVRRHLEENGRVSLRLLRRQYELDDETLDELIEELVDVQRVARREENVLVWAAQPKPDTVARAPVTARAAEQADARKIVTILFADLAGSTALHERLDPESVRQFMEGYYTAMRAAVDAHGGTVVKLLGDGVMAAFGVPTVAEDDALRAVRAGMGMQQAFRHVAGEQSARVGDIGLRVAINTGEVVVNADHSDVLGDPVNVAARLQQEARNGDVVLGESTQRLVGALVTLTPLGSVALKGRAEAVKAYRVESLERPAVAGAAAFVGRDAELARLTAIRDAAASAPAARLAVLLGSPGLGKSRLIDELGCRVGDSATVITAHCDATGGATFAPLAAALRQWLAAGQADGTDGDDPSAALEALLPESPERSRIAGGIAALLAGSPAAPEETFFVVRRFLAALAQEKPVVLVIDDLHWAEPLLLDLVEHLVQWGSGVPLFVLVGARPELRDLRSSLVTPGGLVADVLTLSGLDAGAAMRLAANEIGAADLPAAVAAKVLATSEGNPLFVRELVRMLVDEGAIERQGERWIVGANLAALEMPPTIHALLAARIERLRPDERTVLERAAIVGRHFSRNAVAALLSHNGSGSRAVASCEGPELDARLEALRRSELIEPDSGWFLGEPMLRFHHVLIRDAAYRRLLKGTRAELHARFAEWVAARAGEADHDETIGWHLEQAHQLLRELGPLDAAGRGLGEQAARRLAAAGRRALGRDDLSVAADLLGRAIDRLDPADATRADLALDWCEALLSAGDVSAATKAINELERFAGDKGIGGHEDKGLGGYGVTGLGVPSDSSVTPNPLTPNPLRLRAWHTCFIGQLTALTAPERLQATADAVAAAAEELAKLDDAAGEAKAHSVRAQALARLGKVGACEAALDQALAAARKAGDRRRANAVLAGAPVAALWGPSPVTRASGRCLDVVRVLRITQGAPAVEAVALSCQAVLEALRGRTDAARRMLASARKMVEDLGIAQRLFEVDFFAGRIELLEGDAAGAERLLRGAYEGLRDLGLGIDAARAGALLARALLAQERVDEADTLSHESERLAGDDLQAAIAWRGVRAEALAKRGEHAAAVELAKAAVAIASATDALLDHADARVALAAALRAAGHGAEAAAEERRAIELWETKGATLLAELRTRRPEVRVRARWSHAHPPRGEPRESKRPLRRVRPNGATAMQARFDAALAARDFDAITAVFHEDHQEIDHPTGSSYGREAAIASLQRLFRSRDPHYQAAPLATLGEFLLLVRRCSGAAGAASARYDVGAYENEAIQLFEVDASGLCRRAEVFAADRLGEAIVRLYERHAELLPAGPARIRAAAVARSVAAWNGPIDPDRLATVYAPSLRNVDHRFLGTWSARNAEEILGHFRLQLDLAPDFAARYEDVFAVAADALVASITFFGTARDSGGAFENRVCAFFTFGADGLVTETEVFEAEQVGEALARFDALAGAAPAVEARRRTRANAATRGVEQFKSALAARDGAALADVFDESLHVVHHPTRAAYGRREMLGTWRSVIKAERFDLHSEILASLGGALALERHFLALEGLAEAHVAGFGRTEFHELALIEADDRGRWVHCEIFATDRLRSAIVRLYERWAESLPEGPARIRASGTARALAAFDGPLDADRIALVHAPSFACVDHRTLGTWSAKGRDEWHTHWQGQADLAAGWMLRDDDVLALEPAAMVLRQSFLGTGVASGGAFENAVISVVTLGADGLITRTEVFEPDQEAEALACLDTLVGNEAAPPEAPFANAASRLVERGVRGWAARDWDGLVAELSPALRMDDRRRMMRLEIGYADFVAQFRMLFDQPASRWHETLLATRGERLSLHRTSFAAEVAGGGGALAFDDHLSLTEVDRDGRWIASVTFDLADQDAAYAELDARYYAGEGVAHPAHGAIMRAFTRAVVSRDWGPVLALCAPEFIEHDHRRLAVLGTTRGAAAWAQNFSMLVDLAPDTVYRVDHLRSAVHGFCSVGTWVGSRDGGRYEIPLIAILELDPRDRLARADIYDPDQLDQVLARFDALRAATPPEPFANAATASAAPVIRCMIAYDWEGFRQLFAEDFHMSDRRRVVQLELDRDQYVAFTREVADGRTIRNRWELVATRGDRLALTRAFYEFTDADVGPSEIAFLILMEVDERGRIVANVRWDVDDLQAAYAELDARWEAGEGAAHPAVIAWRRDFGAALESRDWDAVAAVYSPSIIGHDHRLVSWGTLQGRAAFFESLRQMFELAPDARLQANHLRTSSRGMLSANVWTGTREGGAFESPFVSVVELDAHGKALRNDFYDPHHLDRALARFEEIRASERSVPPSAGPRGTVPLAAVAKANAANTAMDRWRVTFNAGFDTGDWDAMRALCAPDFTFEDRRRLALLSGDRELMIASARERVAIGARPVRRPIGSAGDHVAIEALLWSGGPADGRFEIEYVGVIEVDASGLLASIVLFDLDDAREAQREAWARWAAIDPRAAAPVALVSELVDVFPERDRARLRSLFADDLVVDDHRRTGMGRIEGADAYVGSVTALSELASAICLELGWFWPALGPHGAITTLHLSDDVARGGGAFESDYLYLFMHAQGRITHVEMFELEQLDAALARFTELGAASR